MHPRHASGLALLVCSVLFASLHAAAAHFFLYWAWWWFDIVMHALGGFLIAGFLLWLVAFEVPASIRPRVPRLVLAVLLALIIGVLWEIFEYVFGISGASEHGLDTILDLGADVGGALIGYLVFKRYG